MNFEGIYCFDTASVRFAVYPDGPRGARIVAQISEETLHDEFGTHEVGQDLLDVCRRYFAFIEPVVIARYRADPKQQITLSLGDFAAHRRFSMPVHQDSALAA